MKKMKEIVVLSNANIVRNANGFLSERNLDDVENIEWIGNSKKRLPQNKFKMTY